MFFLFFLVLPQFFVKLHLMIFDNPADNQIDENTNIGGNLTCFGISKRNKN